MAENWNWIGALRAVRWRWGIAIVLLALGAGRAAVAAPPSRADNAHIQLSRDRVLGQTRIPVYGYRVVATYPHDATSYTEGLVMRDGRLYEGTGRFGWSRLRQVDLATGRALKDIRLPPGIFGEGITVLGNRIYQLTYLANEGIVYDRATFARTQTFRYGAQGWGLTTDGKHLLMSNGSAAIQFLDLKTFAVRKTVIVSDDVGPVGFLNELEFHDGKLYANVWQTDFIAIIDPGTGKIVGWIDLTGLNPDPARLKYPFVLNGIAVNDRTGRLLVTGKCWPKLFEIDLVRRRN